MQFHNKKCIVIKVGSSLLIGDDKKINENWLASFIFDIASLWKKGIKIIIVSSGASACGCTALGLKRNQLPINAQSAVAGVGQAIMIENYRKLLSKHDLQAAQLLLSLFDINMPQQFKYFRSTIDSMFKLNIIPIFNENDSVSIKAFRYGDNDRLAARIAKIINAEAVVILSDIDGLYTSNPKYNRNARLLTTVHEITKEIEEMAGGSDFKYGSG